MFDIHMLELVMAICGIPAIIFALVYCFNIWEDKT